MTKGVPYELRYSANTTSLTSEQECAREYADVIINREPNQVPGSSSHILVIAQLLLQFWQGGG